MSLFQATIKGTKSLPKKYKVNKNHKLSISLIFNTIFSFITSHLIYLEMESKAGNLICKGLVIEGFTIYEGVLGMRVNTLGASHKDTINYARAFFLKAN